jgi:hypothetical protein
MSLDKQDKATLSQPLFGYQAAIGRRIAMVLSLRHLQDVGGVDKSANEHCEVPHVPVAAPVDDS